MRYWFSVCFLIAIFFNSCINKEKETETSGTAKMLVDESLTPIIEDELVVFENIYKNAKIDASYQTEGNLIKNLLADSARIAIMARTLRPDEAKIIQNRKLLIHVNRFAIDAIALVANKASVDTLITVQELIDILNGKFSKRQLVFDNANSSTVRYLMELAGIKQLPEKGVYALNSNQEVIKYVHNNLGSIGVIGFNWIKQPPVELEGTVAELKMMRVKNLPGKPGSDKYYIPNQDNLAQEQYPLSRNVYIINCQAGGGLGLGFASFLAGEVGQRVVLKSGLMPDSIPTREILIRKNKE
ncbi:Putative phosphate ABC transporter, phosphate-binding component [Arcticibacter svalbardensis MN12-7]|uniref:Putative phosphate ABC transporter, phosphate-binding component n=1 Tax=Arcticibacter svalbardensis MN12-7 TaxID=1150600 RepID=R9GMW1_9SPHI|nr:substrate-binding domain-containing protein [Arcticibacter svalbardensis]EOR93147.1 Putative phosphate ABC transporter, phosphate-binding component [Arcticibacter svalbardensis MN12-7]